ncbi:CDP-glycerol glycerophosphotransferase family protein [Camelliibacillus cellulosilyticus]|uniref:CDP-glycerol glycerophosphotransferase family protein n=1 Tax=Camelliibacillus cellulosilyticus TaxID=2174486 RepID=A0ABV9GT51_9BACL
MYLQKELGLAFTATIHDIEWERVNLKISGLIAGDLNADYTFYLKSKDDELKIPHQQIERHSFYLSLNITTLNHGDRIPDGHWYIIARNSLGETINVNIAGNINDCNEYSREFKSGNKRVYKVHTFEEINRNFGLDIFFDCPINSKRKKVTFRRRMYDLRVKVYVGIFNFAKKHFKKNGKRILFTSASRDSMGGNLGAVYNRLLERRLNKEFTVLKVFKSNIWSRSNLIDKFRLPFYLGIADYIFLEDYHPMVNQLTYDKNTEIIQLWHANGAFKTFGYSRLGKPASPLIDGINHRIYTKAITSSKHVIPYYAEAFAISEDNVISTGIPKTDMFFKEEYRKGKIEKIHKVFPQIKEAKKVILFGPTFRGGGPKTAYYPMNKIDFKKMAEYCRANNAIVLFKMHFLVKNKLIIPQQYRDVLIDATNYREINDILFVADLLITDYSSTIYEYSLLNKPMLFYAFDLEEYIASRDFYDKFEEFVPGKIVKHFDELMEAIYKEDFDFDKVKEFRNKNFDYLDGGASDRVIDWLVLKKRVYDQEYIKLSRATNEYDGKETAAATLKGDI